MPCRKFNIFSAGRVPDALEKRSVDSVRRPATPPQSLIAASQQDLPETDENSLVTSVMANNGGSRAPEERTDEIDRDLAAMPEQDPDA